MLSMFESDNKRQNNEEHIIMVSQKNKKDFRNRREQYKDNIIPQKKKLRSFWDWAEKNLEDMIPTGHI